MARKITLRELREKSGEIVRALDRGESFVVTRDGVPVAELTSLRRRFVRVETAVAVFRSAPALDPRRFQGDVDAPLDQNPAPRGFPD